MIRFVSLAILAALAVSACAPSGGEEKEGPSQSPFGYELAQVDNGKAACNLASY